MSEWATHQEELSRKALEVLHDTVYKYQSGLIDGRECRLMVSVVYDTIVGLVPWDVTDVFEAVIKDLSRGL